MNHPALIRLSKAEQALAQAKDLSDFKKIIDIAEAARVYAKAAKVGEDAARHAEEIKLKAQRGAGALLAQLQKGKGGGDTRQHSTQAVRSASEYRKTLEEAEIDRGSAQRWQQVAAVPEPKFREYLKETEKAGKEITTSGLLKESRAETKREQKQAAVETIRSEVALPSDVYRVIALDPPWKYGSRAEDPTHRARNPYPDMDVEQIKALPVATLAHQDAIVWLWTTNAFMREAFECLDAWGFQSKTILTWVKDRMGTGDWLRGKTEHCIMAVRGNPIVTLTNQTTALAAPMREHSRKPDEFFALVDSLCPGNKLEMFARQPREGWSSWGAEVNAFVAA